MGCASKAICVVMMSTIVRTVLMKITALIEAVDMMSSHVTTVYVLPTLIVVMEQLTALTTLMNATALQDLGLHLAPARLWNLNVTMVAV